MRWRQVGWLYAVAVILAAVYLRPVPTERHADAEGGPRRPKLFALEAARLSEITIEHAGRRVVARRDGEGWAVEEPAGSGVPSDLVQAFAVAVLDAEAIERVDGDPDLSSFGLDDSATRVELRPSGGPPETIWLGAANPSGTAVYARRLGTPGVVLVGRTLRYYEELILQALPRPTVPADTPEGPVAGRGALTSRRTAV
jgi:uncharacterized protein DUF4340